MKKKIYHVFTDNEDGFFESYKEALKLYHEYKVKGYDRRLYKEVYADQEDFENDVVEHEYCIYSQGSFPN